MKIGIVSRSESKKFLELAEKIINNLPAEKIISNHSIAERLGIKGKKIGKMNADSIVTIGGDGTVLHTIQKAPDTPILGINMGGRGFLADVNPSEMNEAIDKLSKGELEVVEKEKLSVEVSGEHLANALNEGVIRSKEPSRILPFKLWVDEEEAEKNRGDGLIVSTPTGSTAYSMAAGGPVVDPKLNAFVITALSTHRPRAMPLVCPMSSEIRVELLGDDRKADVTVDGQVTATAEKGDTIRFKKSKDKAKFYSWNNNFYEKVKEKL